MFERYSEPARRSIFFARYEASQFGSGHIETEHLLLGLLRESRGLVEQLQIGSTEAFRKRIEERLKPSGEKIATSMDLPLSHDCRRALAYAARDASQLGHKTIEPAHLILGLLHMEQCGAAELLREHGIVYHSFREEVGKTPQPSSPPRPLSPGVTWQPEPEPEPAPQPPAPAAASLANPLQRLSNLVTAAESHLKFPNFDGETFLKRKDWSRKEAIGHLIDWAASHHQWIARALTQPKLAAAGYPLDEWVSAQQYRTAAWKDLVELWVRLNRMLLHTMAQIPEEKVVMSCRVGIEDPATLLTLIERYVEYCDDVIGQVLVRD